MARRSPSAPSSRVFWLGLTLILLIVFLVQGLVLARLLVPSHDSYEVYRRVSRPATGGTSGRPAAGEAGAATSRDVS